MRVKMLIGVAVLLAIAVPAQARAGGIAGTVIAKHTQRGTVVLAGPRGTGLTVHAQAARLRLGDRVHGQGARLDDGTIRMSQLRVLSRTRLVLIRGTVVRDLPHSLLVATGGSVITIRQTTRSLAATRDHGELQAGTNGEFRVRIDDDELVEAAAVPLGPSANVQIEGAIVTVSPLVVSVEGLPITITVPSGTILPPTLAAGQRIELTVQTATGNVFTLVTIDETANENDDANDNPAAPADQEVEATGSVVTSTAMQLVVNSSGTMFTFTASAGTTLPILPTGTLVEARGLTVNGVLTLERLQLEDNNAPGLADGSRGGGHDGSGDSGGHQGDSGGGGHGNSH